MKGHGFIPREGKTMLPSYEEVRCFPDINGNEVWHLPPGYYMVDFIEGCNIIKEASSKGTPNANNIENKGIVSPFKFN